MTKYIAHLKSIWKNRPIYITFESMPDSLVFFFFVSASLPATYWNYVLGKLYGPYINAFNEVGFTLVGAVISLVMLGLILQAWFFTSITARCGKLVFDRWFQ